MIRPAPISVPFHLSIHERSPDSLEALEEGKSIVHLRHGDFRHAATKKGRGQASPSEPFLIIGFDTEYKGPDGPLTREEVKENKARYRVLSYQFHCRTSAGQEWSGIGCPDDDERISMGEFLVYALGIGVRDHGVTALPTLIYLVGHFTRADVPAFSDFKALQGLMSAVRNTFISIDGYLPVQVCFGGDSKVLLRVLIRDTMLLAPAGSLGLEALGDLVGRPKIHLDSDKDRECHLKRNMDELRRQNWPLFRDYAVNDASICVDYAAMIMERYTEITGSRKLPVTLSAIGVDLLLRSWKAAGLAPNDVLGQEEVPETRWAPERQRYVRTKRTVPVAECHIWTDLVTECYHGGRNEQFWFGPGHEAEWTDFDLASAYPTAMGLIGKPNWREARFSVDAADFDATTLGFAQVEFCFPDSVRFPSMPIRTENGLIFPRRGCCYCAAPEIALAVQLGAEITIKNGVIISTDSDVRIFGRFIKDCLERRGKHPKKSLDALFWKEASNSTYGKTAQGLREKRVYDMRQRETMRLPPSRITNPFFAAFITSFVRATLGEIINALPSTVTVFSCTTDGFLTDASAAEIESAQLGTLAQTFGRSRQELTGKPTVLEKKHAVRQPLGWRTRGQATLKPGPSQLDDAGFGIILARAGISVPKAFSQMEANNHIVELFFGRTPEHLIFSSSFTGIRDMVEHEADLVDTQTIKRLSMEFDWKRKPIDVRTDPERGHVAFDTEPWKTVDDFRQVRDAWNTYQTGRPACIKTEADLRAFVVFLSAQLNLPASSRRYLRREHPDVNRLRQVLRRAWASSQAGLTYAGSAKVDGHEVRSVDATLFARILCRCGIDCKRHHVEAARRKGNAFQPNACPSTAQCFAAVRELVEYFPTLRPADLFAVGDNVPFSLYDSDHVVPLTIVAVPTEGPEPRHPEAVGCGGRLSTNRADGVTNLDPHCD